MNYINKILFQCSEHFMNFMWTSFQKKNSMPSLCIYQKHQTNMFILAIILIFIITFPHCDANDPTITIPNVGTLSYTSTSSSWSSNNIFRFRGVRFAESPTGNRRFKVCWKIKAIFVLLVRKYFVNNNRVLGSGTNIWTKWNSNSW